MTEKINQYQEPASSGMLVREAQRQPHSNEQELLSKLENMERDITRELFDPNYPDPCTRTRIQRIRKLVALSTPPPSDPAPAPDDETFEKDMICSWSDQLAVILRENSEEAEGSTAVAQGSKPAAVQEMQTPSELPITQGCERTDPLEPVSELTQVVVDSPKETISEVGQLVGNGSKEDILVEMNDEEDDSSTSISARNEGFRSLDIFIRFG